MEQAAEELRFERAAELRDRLRAIEGLTNKQRVIATAFADTDAIGFCRGAKTCFAVLHFVDGSLVGKDVEMMDEPLEDDGEARVRPCAAVLYGAPRRMAEVGAAAMRDRRPGGA